MPLICFRLSDCIIKEIDDLVEAGIFATRAEAIRQAIHELFLENGIHINESAIVMNTSKGLKVHWLG